MEVEFSFSRPEKQYETFVVNINNKRKRLKKYIAFLSILKFPSRHHFEFRDVSKLQPFTLDFNRDQMTS